MSGAVTLATARRVLQQLRRDPRTVALLIVVPALLMTLFRWVLNDQRVAFNRIGAPVFGVFPMIVMFVVASVATLRERRTGTLERLLTMPMHKLDLLLGYGIAFGAAAIAQVGVCLLLTIGPLGLRVSGSGWLLFLIGVCSALLGMALGLLLSAFAGSEFQAVQFMPAVMFPQLLLCGLVTPRDKMDSVLHGASDALPMTYAVDALQRVTRTARVDGQLVVDLVVLALVAVAALALGAATLRRRTA
jgi:ABC-2 type transport system permease protein